MFVNLAGNIDGISRFTRTYTRLFREGVTNQWPLFSAVCIGDVVAAACQGMVIATLVTASRIATSQEPTAGLVPLLSPIDTLLDDFSTSFDLSRSALAFYVAAILSAVLLIISVSSTYFAAILSRRLARRYHERSINFLLDSYFGQGRFNLLTNTNDFQLVQRSLMQYSIHSSNALEAVSRLFQTFAFTVLFFGSAFLIEWRVMSLMTVCGLLFLPAIMFVSRHTHSVASSFFETSSVSMGRRISKLLRAVDGLYQPNEDRRDLISEFMRSEPVKLYFDNYDGIQLASERMSFLTGLVRAGVFGIGMLLITTAVVIGWADIAVIVAFAGALTIAFSYLQSLFARLANLNLYYPQVDRYFRLQDYVFSDPGNQEVELITATSSMRHVISCSPTLEQQSQERLDAIEVGAGSVVDFLTATPLSRYDMGRWLAPLRDSARPPFDGSDIVLVTNRVQDLSPVTVHYLETALETQGLGGVEALASRLGVDAGLRQWYGRFNASSGSGLLDANALRDVPSELRALFAFAVAALSEGSTAFIEAETIAQLPSERRHETRAVLAHKLVFIWRLPNVKGPIEPDYHLVLGPTGAITLFAKGTADTILNSALPEPSMERAAGADDSAALLLG